jgi:hypothetical protein
MSDPLKQIESAVPFHNWYGHALECFQEEAEALGVEISTERDKTPAISFSGFWSQGDGLSFDAYIRVEKFLEANKGFQEKLPKWFLFLVANPDAVNISCSRHSHHSHTMSVLIDDYIHDNFVQGFFAGVDDYDLNNQLSFMELEHYMVDYFNTMAKGFYDRLEKEYEYQLEFERERIKENFIDKYEEEIREVLVACMLCGEKFTLEDCERILWELDITLSELKEIEFVDYHHKPTTKVDYYYKVTDKGKEFVCPKTNGS